MNIKVIKGDGKFYISVSGYKKTIKEYYVKNSWDLSPPERKSFNKDLFNNQFDIMNNSINLYDAMIEVKPLEMQTHYYTLMLIDENGLEYAFHIDYPMFYNIKVDESLFFYELEEDKIFDIEKKRYDFYIKGAYGDVHKLMLNSLINKRKFFINVPDKNLLESPVYDLLITENDNKIFRGRFPIIIKDYIDFATNSVDCGEYEKIILNPKFKHSSLVNIEVSYKGKVLRKVVKPKNNYDTISNIEFYIAKDGFKLDKTLNIKYTMLENSVGSSSVIKNTLLSLEKNKKDEMEVYNFKEEYDHNTDIMKVSWSNKYKKETVNEIYIGGEKFITNDNFITFENFKKYNNNSQFITMTIKCESISGNFNNKKYEHKRSLSNFNFIDLSTPFTPQIDYSDVLYCDKPFGKINWTVPKFRHYSKIKINSIFIKPFLDEYCKPWINDYILDKTAPNFDVRYQNNGESTLLTYAEMQNMSFESEKVIQPFMYEEEFIYDFDHNETRSKTVKDCFLTYDTSSDGYIITTNTNEFNVPLWFSKQGESYKVTIQIYDMFNNHVGENSVEFNILERNPSEIRKEELKFNRNQFLQFGEDGTVGEFYKIENARPIDVRNHYESTFKTFEGQELNDITNTDFDGLSMYYYFNTNEGDNLTLNYMRAHNFFSLEIEVIKKESGEIIFPAKIHYPKGDNFENNTIQFQKNSFNKEGMYTMKIRTFNSTGQSSKVKELNFFVHNDAPEKPFVKIKPLDFEMDENNNVTINKKYFELEVTNNEQSEKYAGWKFKETHFFFREQSSSYSSYPDYIVQTSVNDGSIVMKNNTPIENGEYECKVVNYDYAGNASEPTIFTFTLKSDIKITPETLFVSKTRTPMKWKIEKAQESEGFFHFFRYSADGVNYTDSTHIKVESKYYVNDSTTKRDIELELNWLSEDGQNFKEGFYRLICYEFNKKHPEGQPQYEFESQIVEVNELANPSNPIYAIRVPGSVEVFNRKSYDEWSYTSDLDVIEFESIHNEVIVDNPNTPGKEGQWYEIELIEPGNTNRYSCLLDQPLETGIFKISQLATKCGVVTQKEGVWEIRFITIDKYGNSNAYRGYYTYFVNVIKRNPEINNATITNGTGSKYFGLLSDKIGYYMDSSKNYENIEGFTEHGEKFIINQYEVKFLENPFNSQYTITPRPEGDGAISVMNKLSESDKVTHSKDGRYSITISAIDPLGRKSETVDRLFFISTTTDSEINFVSFNTFNYRDVKLVATAEEKVMSVYYFTEDITNPKPDYNIEEIKKWKRVLAKNIILKEQEVYGIEIEELYLTDGFKTVYYVIEEESGNLSEIKTYQFKIDTTTMLIPIFDLYNKIYFDTIDGKVDISWNATNEALNEFQIKLEKIEVQNDGSYIVSQHYAIAIDNVNLITPVGPEDVTFVNLGNKKSFSFELLHNVYISHGQYKLTVKGLSLYGTSEENSFIFQIDTSSLRDIAFEIKNNKITLDSNLVTWEHIKSAAYYETSYDGKVWIKTTENRFFVNSDMVTKDINGDFNLYIRFKSKSGIYSQPSKIKLNMSMVKVSKPVVEFYTNTITENNHILKWNVIIDEPEKVEGIYYSFDKTKWHYQAVKGKVNTVANAEIEYPVADGTYDVFVVLVDSDPNNTLYFNKSEMVHSYANIFNKEIDKPSFTNIKNGCHLSSPTRLFIENKIPGVKYFIRVNDVDVEEGYEISSSTLKRFNIEVKAKKEGINKIFDVLAKSDQFHVLSLTTEKYIINISNSKVIARVNNEAAELEIESMPHMKTNQVILYREKKFDSKWATLRTGDTLSLLKEWEFHITSFSVID